MKQSVFYSFYLIGVVPFSLSVLLSVPHKYYLIKTQKTWSEAQTYCRQMYTDLATVVSARDWTELQKVTQSSGLLSNAWIGLYNDIKSWRWSFENISLGITNWYGTEPNNWAGCESCAGIDINGYWWDLPCTELKPFLCYNASYSDSARFISIFNPMLTWHDAQTYCRTYHTDLAAVANISDNTQLKRLVQGQWSAWFGLYRDTWKFSDLANATSINWLPGRPNNFWGHENCAFVYNGYINDNNCAALFPFFCHTIPPVTEKPIVKVQVTSEKDLSDPAVQSDILEMIRQKLDLGTARNTTLAWRVQPDGNIFQKQTDSVQSVNNMTVIECEP